MLMAFRPAAPHDADHPLKRRRQGRIESYRKRDHEREEADGESVSLQGVSTGHQAAYSGNAQQQTQITNDADRDQDRRQPGQNGHDQENHAGFDAASQGDRPSSAGFSGKIKT